MDKDFHVVFDKCPVCSSSRQFLKELTQELKDKRLARPEWRQFFDMRQGVLVDQDRQVLMPVGAHLPGYLIATDICMDCGAIYAVELRRLEATTQTVEQPKGMRPPPKLSEIRRN